MKNERKNVRWVVTMRECGGRSRYRECGVLAHSEREARERAVRKFFPGSYWVSDSGLGPNYGQVVLDQQCVTDRVRIDVGLYTATVRHTADGEGWQEL